MELFCFPYVNNKRSLVSNAGTKNKLCTHDQLSLCVPMWFRFFATHNIRACKFYAYFKPLTKNNLKMYIHVLLQF